MFVENHDDAISPWAMMHAKAAPDTLTVARALAAHGAALLAQYPSVQIRRTDDPLAATVGTVVEFRDEDLELTYGYCGECRSLLCPVALWSGAPGGRLTSACPTCGMLFHRDIRGRMGRALLPELELVAVRRGGVLRSVPFGDGGRLWQLPSPGPAFRAVIAELDDPARFGFDPLPRRRSEAPASDTGRQPAGEERGARSSSRGERAVSGVPYDDGGLALANPLAMALLCVLVHADASDGLSLGELSARAWLSLGAGDDLSGVQLRAAFLSLPEAWIVIDGEGEKAHVRLTELGRAVASGMVPVARGRRSSGEAR